MRFIETDIKGVFIIEPQVFGDDRGYFFESFNEREFEKHIGKILFVQDNESKSSFGVLRGLHLQKPPFEQSKLVRVIEGEVLDVVVDVRKKSPTFGKSFSIRLNSENKKQLFIPRGLLHGFVVLSESAIFSYKVDNFYSINHEYGLKWNDDFININWNISENMIKLSNKDEELLYWKEFVTNL